MSFIKVTLAAGAVNQDVPADFVTGGIAFIAVAGSDTAADNCVHLVCVPVGTADDADVLIGTALTNTTFNYVVPTSTTGAKIRIKQGAGEGNDTTYVFFSTYAIGG